jgi:hypothetical protein
MTGMTGGVLRVSSGKIRSETHAVIRLPSRGILDPLADIDNPEYHSVGQVMAGSFGQFLMYKAAVK